MHSGGHCGHHIWARQHNFSYLPRDFMVIMAHDDISMRRLHNGRISSLCADGKWREWEKGRSGKDYPMAFWFHTWAPGPNGTATTSSKAGGHCSRVSYIVTGIDYDAPTTPPLLEATPKPWPPRGDDGAGKGGR
jgi:hypothetical protein